MRITGYHVGPGGNPTGIGEYVRALDEAGKASFVMSADVTTGLSDIYAVWDEGSNVPHIAIYRVVKDGSQFWSVPHYDLSPEDAAADYFNRVEGEIAQEVKDRRDRVWIAIGNELDKNRADWIGEWLYESALIWNSNGYKVCGPGWASGEPEPHHWEGGMLQYLEYCGANPHLAAIAVHEYSYSVDNIENQVDWLIGRYRFIHDTCDARDIPRPKVFITEWGWTLDNAPNTPEQIVSDIRKIHDRYDNYPPHALWWIAGGYGDIYQEIQPSIEPVTNYLLSLPDEEPEPPMPDVLSIAVSHHQREMDWQKAKDAGVDVALIRMSIGNEKDTRADENFAGAAEAGVLRQPFHYLLLGDGDPSWHVQARLFYTWISQLDPPPELPPVIDAEDGGATGNVFNKIRAFTALFYGLARESRKLTNLLPPEVYTRASWWEPYVGTIAWWQRQYPLHVAHFGVEDPLLPDGWDNYVWHQYDCSASGADYGASSTDICLSRFNGTREDFHNYYGIEPEGLGLPRDEYIYWKARQLQQVSVNRDAALERAAAEDGYFLIGSEGRGTHEGIRYAIQPMYGMESADFRAYAAVEGDWGNVFYSDTPPNFGDEEPEYLQVEPLSQRDSRWANLILGQDTGHGVTIGEFGCLMVIYNCMARYLGLTHTLPPEFQEHLVSSGAMYAQYMANGALESAYPDQIESHGWKMRSDSTMHPDIRERLDASFPVPCRVDFIPATSPAEQHWVLLIGALPNDDYWIVDPWTGEIGVLSEVYPISGSDVLEALYYDWKESEPEPGPGPDQIDLLPYMRGQEGLAYELEYDWSGGGTHPVQNHREGNIFWIVKGDSGEYEELWYGTNYIYRGVDTSEAPDRFYAQYTELPGGDLQYGSPWIPRYLAVGEEYSVSPVVIHYWQEDCSERLRGQPANRISLLAHHDSYTFPSGITLDDVIELGWENQERYFFAREVGLAGWAGEGVGQSYIIHFHTNRPLTRNVPPCWSHGGGGGYYA